jgi:hypothetical protein
VLRRLALGQRLRALGARTSEVVTPTSGLGIGQG